MGNKYYFLLFIALAAIAVTIYFLFDLGFKYCIIAGGVLVFYLTLKEEISGSKWFPPRPTVPKHRTVVRRPLILTDREKQGYTTLIDLCVNPNHKAIIRNFIESWDNNNEWKEDETDTVLNYIMDFLDDENHFYHFIMRLDWKEEVPTLMWRLQNSAKDNFDIVLQLPDPSEKFGDNASISSPGVFTYYDSCLRGSGLQMGLMDTKSDEYIVIVHRMEDKNKIEDVVQKTGYRYIEPKF